MEKSSEHSKKVSGYGEALVTFVRSRGIEIGLVVRLIANCELFREICADYEECCETLLRLERRGNPGRGQLRDYLEMRGHLERDLLRCIEDHIAHPTNGRETGEGSTK